LEKGFGKNTLILEKSQIKNPSYVMYEGFFIVFSLSPGENTYLIIRQLRGSGKTIGKTIEIEKKCCSFTTLQNLF
jgi:hypothetical protein